jgi:sec-independent protein translocase protein TatA
MGLSLPHILIFGLIAVLLLGRGKISGLMEDVGQGIKSFKKGMADETESASNASNVKSISHSDPAPVVNEVKSSDKTA